MIELRPLQQFLAVAELLHFGRAAERLHMSQPPLTQAVRKLEVQLGVQLFERSSRSVRLTPAGAALQASAQKLLAEAAALPSEVRAVADGLAGRLRLAFVSTVGFGGLPQWLRSFREACPQVALSLREATLDVQLREFEAGSIDAGFVIHTPGAAPAGFQRLSIGIEPLVLALPSSDETPSDAQCLTAPLVIFPREVAPSLYDAILAHHGSAGVAQEAIQMQTIINLVSAAIGVAWVPASLQGLQRAGVSYRDMPGAPQVETSLIWRADAPPVVARFVEHVRTHA
ncbi:DNA-binding transcriptional LysR family regulator [Pelomonas saccharophila]|uniref:DNA-binding transcriptional LysR family regulator n=1 Tax=Roseateles saccharophilus TaxID=304 RepID=A0ABU1YII7_ROSSA|nr:LysR family transcriptional regulator [Roseateles saccharophilus]MDR7267866.1 DNA-binding transcriptional LysR family regulator [Roseateles saccharophilus]